MENELVKVQKNNVNEKMIIDLADEMAACTASLNAHTYSMFIEAREMLKKKVHEVCTKYDETR